LVIPVLAGVALVGKDMDGKNKGSKTHHLTSLTIVFQGS
tara:strand:+ start:2623 stop:2739 length:117 start_codon:yes stop_codon:yes gene_type:complete